MLKISQISNELVKSLFSDLMRKWVGPHKLYSVTELAATTQQLDRTLESYRSGQALPPLDKFLQIAMAIEDPAFMNGFLAIMGMTGARRIEAEEQDPFVINSAIAHLVGNLSDGLKDRHLDHQECQQLLPQIEQVMTELNHFYFSLKNRCDTLKGRSLQ